MDADTEHGTTDLKIHTKRVLKWQFRDAGYDLFLDLPRATRFVFVDVEPGRVVPSVWTESITDEPNVAWQVTYIGTGMSVPYSWTHIGSCVANANGQRLVWHCYAHRGE